MASTTLFAPSIRAVQPAFIYSSSSGTAKVYFTLNYNTIGQVAHLRYSLIDPNKSSIDGSNSMFSSGTTQKVEESDIISVDGEYYFNIDFSSGFKSLTINQFYQIQIELQDSSGNWSVPSQPSLIRPIPSVSTKSVTGSNQKLQGSIAYTDDSTIETIATYKYTIGSYTSPMITNTLGLSFEAIIPSNVVLNSNQVITVNYTTKHGYSSNFTGNYTASTPTMTPPASISIQLDTGSISVNYSNGTANTFRAASITNYDVWEKLATNTTTFTDFTVASKEKYKYNSDSNAATNIQSCPFEDIFIQDQNKMVAIRYNPKISSFKYVTQDSITNTLGGKYPIIRRNGATYYRQFSLTGALYLEYQKPTDFTCSIQGWTPNNKCSFQDDPSSLYLNRTIQNYNTTWLQNHLREVAMEFLTDGNLKLLRSPEEGNMIVVLTNISFTPNATSGRRVYDFSATVTEVCEATIENIKKLVLNNMIVNYQDVNEYIGGTSS